MIQGKDKIELFWSRVKKQDIGCWLWTGGLFGNGYGQFFYQGKSLSAHRVSYSLANGEIPKGMLVCHKCDNPVCVNPEHLFLGSHGDNVRDCVKKGRHESVKRFMRVTDIRNSLKSIVEWNSANNVLPGELMATAKAALQIV